jgi:DNA-binding NarL/FixJ family response regulator
MISAVPEEGLMAEHLKLVVFDVDPDSLDSLRQALPGWQVEEIYGASTASLTRDWDPVATALLVDAARDRPEETLALCRGLRCQVGRAHTPLLVLVTDRQQAVVGAALEAGAHGCLVLPIHPKEVVAAWDRARAGNRPGHHTLGLQRAQREDLWRDTGGEA